MNKIAKISLLTIFCATWFLIFSCPSEAAKTADYKDPYVEYSISGAEDKGPLSMNNSDPSGFKQITIGVVLTNNTAKTTELVKKFSGSMTKWKNYSAAKDCDAPLLISSLLAKLGQHFKKVVVLNGEDDPQTKVVDAVMYLDVKVTLGTWSGTQTSITAQGIIVDHNKNLIGKVEGLGAGVVPQPAFDVGFNTATNMLAENFDYKLGDASYLAAHIKNLPKGNVLKRIALVIGNGNYISAPLKNAIADAKLIATALNNIGVDTVYVENIKDVKEFVSVLKYFNNKAKNADVSLFYYAGHGIRIQGKNYLIPIGAQLKAISDLDLQCLDLDQTLALLAEGSKAVNVGIIDACRDNPFLSSSRSLSSRGLAAVSKAPSETLIAYSTSPGSVAQDGNGGNSPYALALAKVLGEKNLQIEEVFKKVSAIVNKETDGKQIPWESSSIEKQLILNP